MATTSSRSAAVIAKSIEGVCAALRKGDGASALEQLVGVWGKARLPRLSKAISALSDKLVVPPIEVGTDQQRAYLAWCERATPRRAADVGPLVAAFLEALETQKLRDYFREGLLKVLATFPPDPRLDALCDALPDWKESAYFRSALFERVAKRHADPAKAHPGLAPHLAKVAPRAGLEEELAAELTALERTIATAKLKPVGVAEVKAPGADSAESLLAAIYADPGNDALRQTYADRLAEQSDPRGELIALQFQRAAGTLTAEGEAREQALLNRHLSDWLGPLGAHVVKTSVKFEKGFPVAARAKASRIFQAREALELPEWATVRELEFHKTAFFGRTMRSLTTALNVSEFGVRTLMELDPLPPLVVLTMRPSSEYTRGAPATWPWLATIKRLTRLEELVVSLSFENEHEAEAVIDALAVSLAPSVWRLGLVQLYFPPANLPAVLARMPAQLREVEVNGTAWNRTGDGWARG